MRTYEPLRGFGEEWLVSIRARWSDLHTMFDQYFFYRRRTFYVIRTDAIDRLGTRLEQRFSAAQIRTMMLAA